MVTHFFFFWDKRFRQPFQLCAWSTMCGSCCTVSPSLIIQAFQLGERAVKGPPKQKNTHKCNLNSKHSSVMREWLTAMGARTLKATFKSLHATLSMWALTCCGSVGLKAAVWEACRIRNDFPPHHFNYTGSLVMNRLLKCQLSSLNKASRVLSLLSLFF